MKVRSNLVKMGDEGSGSFKVLSMSKILSTITMILSTRLLIHSVSSVLHYGELGD
jgi:hypothetical protein